MTMSKCRLDTNTKERLLCWHLPQNLLNKDANMVENHKLVSASKKNKPFIILATHDITPKRVTSLRCPSPRYSDKATQLLT